MKMTIESTTQIVKVATAPGGPDLECRVWEGETAGGFKVQCLIIYIAAQSSDGQAFPPRMIL